MFGLFEMRYERRAGTQDHAPYHHAAQQIEADCKFLSYPTLFPSKHDTLPLPPPPHPTIMLNNKVKCQLQHKYMVF